MAAEIAVSVRLAHLAFRVIARSVLEILRVMVHFALVA